MDAAHSARLASGIYGVRFPALFYDPMREDTDTSDTTYTMSYTINGNASTSGELQITALDRVGNPNPQDIYVLKDTQPPNLENQSMSVANDQHVYLASSTLLYYRPGASGSLTVSASSSDPLEQGYNGSGVQQLTFPTLFGYTPPADNIAPYAASYTIVDNTNTDGSYSISTLEIPSAVPREWTRWTTASAARRYR